MPPLIYWDSRQDYARACWWVQWYWTTFPTPVAWWLMRRWLEDFAYRIQLQWWMFACAGLLILAVALLTISYQSVKAALADPARSLRTE